MRMHVASLKEAQMDHWESHSAADTKPPDLGNNLVPGCGGHPSVTGFLPFLGLFMTLRI